MNESSNMIRESLIDLGADLVGFADLSVIPSEFRYNMKYGISIAKAIDPNIVNSIYNGPNKNYYEEYYRLNDFLNNIGETIASKIKDMGFNAIAKTKKEVKVNPEERTTELPHKTVATRSGLGWIGKNALLVTEKFGSAIRLTSVLTNMELEVREPIIESRCGNCNICKSVCGAGAVKGINWNPTLQRQEFYDAHACREEARRLSGLQGINESLCGICIHTCPYTKRYIESKGIKYIPWDKDN